VAGALLLTDVPVRSLQLVIAVAMIAVGLFSFLKRDLGQVASACEPSNAQATLGYALTLALAVYGGFFSGGYVTMLTAVFAVFLHMTFVESIAATKLMNVFSSVAATAIFAWRGIVDFRLGVLLAVVAFAGGLLGGTITLKLNTAWLRRIFIIAVLALAVRMLIAVA
jgi:uncharacterized protein